MCGGVGCVQGVPLGVGVISLVVHFVGNRQHRIDCGLVGALPFIRLPKLLLPHTDDAVGGYKL